MSSLNPKTYDTIPPQKVAFLGLGVMGYPMAGHLALAGHSVTVYNRTAAKSQRLGRQAQAAGSLSGHAASARPRDADIVFCCVGNDDDLRSVVLGDNGAFAGMAQGRDLRRPHDRFGRCRARAVEGRGEARPAIHRRAGLRRPGRRRRKAC